jgi:hypothetical protein
LPAVTGLLLGERAENHRTWLSWTLTSTGYSYWTNTTFKWPLLFSAASCLAGNVAYVAAYDTQSLSLLYAARLLTGLGECHCSDLDPESPSPYRSGRKH